MKYILDTDTLIYFLKGNERVVQQVINFLPDDISTTIINHAELLFGAFNSMKKKENLEKINGFLNKIEILPFCQGSAHVFAEHKALLKQQGSMIADMDLMIASIALFNGKILVSNNLKHFARIKKLKIENWYA